MHLPRVYLCQRIPRFERSFFQFAQRAARGFFWLAIPLVARPQNAPPVPDHPWDSKAAQSSLRKLDGRLTGEFQLSPGVVYSLPQLIDLAEQHNPETRGAWEAAKAQASALGVARSDLFPTVAATAFGQTSQTGVLLYDTFVKQILGIAEGEFTLSYTVFDFGARLGRIARERSNLLAANFQFNDVHRRIIFQVMTYYYQLLNANGQRKAAEVNLENARAVEQAAEARLAHGLATLPDVLEARSATAQAEYDLQTTIGAEETATGDLATALMAAPSSELHVSGIDTLEVPREIGATVHDLIAQALEQRPDLLVRLEDLQGAEADIRQARSAYYPSLSFQGNYGYLRAYGEQPPFNAAYAGAPVYNAQLSLSWTIFDGGRRRNQLEQSKSAEKEAQARAESTRDQIADEVWRSYSDTKTALRQRLAAATLLDASNSSYSAALESYNYGVRNILDVLSAQRTLAQARSADISARSRVLTDFADLAYRTADLVQHPLDKAKP